MAGFDFRVKVANPTEDAFIRRLLHATQLRCRQRWVTLRYRRDGSGYYVTVDGPLTNIQSTRAPLALMLAGMIDAVPSALTRRRRMQVGRRVLLGYVRGAWDITVEVLDLSRMLKGTFSSYVFDAVDDPVVQYRLDGLTSVLQEWNNENASPEQTLEELHTVTELIMGSMLGERWDDRAYSEQAAEMVRRSLLSERDGAVLLDLKDRRRAVRHHRGTMDRVQLAALLPDALAVLHRLVARL
jgi:hypothetical protein